MSTLALAHCSELTAFSRTNTGRALLARVGQCFPHRRALLDRLPLLHRRKPAGLHPNRMPLTGGLIGCTHHAVKLDVSCRSFMTVAASCSDRRGFCPRAAAPAEKFRIHAPRPSLLPEHGEV